MESKDYVIAVEFTLEDLINTVNSLIEQGWKPQGGLFVCLGRGEQYGFSDYHQAMIKDLD